MSDTKQQCPQCEKWQQVSGLSTPEELDKIMDNVLSKNIAPIRPLLDALADSPIEGEPTDNVKPKASGVCICGHDSGKHGERNPSCSFCQCNDYRDSGLSASAAGSGAREWYWSNRNKFQVEDGGYNITAMLQAYADSLTAPLWEQLDKRGQLIDQLTDKWNRVEAELTAERTRREAAEALVKQDGWYLIYADRLTYDGKKYGREGETNHGGNCLAWYEHAVFWRERAEATERELEYWKSMAALRGKGE